MAGQRVVAANLLAPIDVVAALAEHAPDGVKTIPDVYEVPKGAKYAYFVIDRSALRAADVKNPDANVLRVVIEQSIDGGVTFGNDAGDQGAYRVGKGDEAQSFSLRDELVIGGGVITPAQDVARGVQEVADAWNSQALGPLATHIRLAYEVYAPIKCGMKVAFN